MLEPIVPPTAPAVPATPSTPTPAPSATPPTPAPAPGTPAPSPGSQPVTDDIASIQDGNWKELRSKAQQYRDKAAVLDTLGIDTAELPDVAKAFTAIRTEAQTLAKDVMGTDYDEADFKAAFAKDPAGLIAILRAEKAKGPAAPPPAARPGESATDYAQRIKDEVALQTKPYTEHINRQISEQVVAKIGTETATALDAALPGAPPEVRDLVMDYVAEYLSSPEQSKLIVAMKARGDYSSVAETTKLVAGRLQTAFQKWVASETARTGGRSTARHASPVAPSAPGGKRPSLDEIINDPGVLGPAYAAR